MKSGVIWKRAGIKGFCARARRPRCIFHILLQPGVLHFLAARSRSGRCETDPPASPNGNLHATLPAWHFSDRVHSTVQLWRASEISVRPVDASVRERSDADRHHHFMTMSDVLKCSLCYICVCGAKKRFVAKTILLTQTAQWQEAHAALCDLWHAQGYLSSLFASKLWMGLFALYSQSILSLNWIKPLI